MHLAQNGNSSDEEWTMSRVGRSSSSWAYVYAWKVLTNGYVTSEQIWHEQMNKVYAVRPVFYLSSDVKIKSGGTGEKTNPYILDLS